MQRYFAKKVEQPIKISEISKIKLNFGVNSQN